MMQPAHGEAAEEGRSILKRDAPSTKETASGEHFLPAGLYVVATPIGNLADISLRALEVLQGVDAILCEDTRVTSRLLAHYDIKKPLLAYHDHNAQRLLPKVVARLAAGERLAQVTDAGTPLISDPGYRLVTAALEKGVPVIPIPGASAPLAALMAAGLPTDRFLFAGFLPEKSAARRAALAELAAVPATLVFFEAPHRLGAALADMAAVLGDRPAAVCRELTKKFEETRRDALPRLAQAYAGTKVKGEVVVVVGGPAKAEPAHDLDALLEEALARLSLSAAVREVTEMTGLSRRQVYERALKLKGSET